MAEELSVVSKTRDYSDIVKLQDPGILEEFLAEPLTFIAETITGALGDGGNGLAIRGGRIVQAILKGNLFQQWAAEFNGLRERGRIPDDFAETKYGFQTWVELMTIIDEESPDADRLEALKAMFFALNKVNATDGERIAAYQMWQVTKGLTSGELFLLKIVYEQQQSYGSDDNYRTWSTHMARASGHGMTALIDLHEKKLTELGLLSERKFGDGSGIYSSNARLTEFGIRFCLNIRNYTLEIGQNG
jgi:hypothetical protein